MTSPGRLGSLLLAASLALGGAACPTATAPAPGPAWAEGLDTRAFPEDTRGDYAVFAQRCSKCHSLARPLNSGIVDDDYWAMYVARMRRQPASGISRDDERIILRFLHAYSAQQRRAKERALADVPAADAAAPTAPAAPTADDGGR